MAVDRWRLPTAPGVNASGSAADTPATEPGGWPDGPPPEGEVTTTNADRGND